MRPLIADFFCGAGLVYDGLVEAGLQPVGFDVAPQPNYPGPFVQIDVLDIDERMLDMFPMIWASPPCLEGTELHDSARREQIAHGVDETIHVDLIEPTQGILDRWAARTGGDFTIENVRNTKRLRNPFILCGSMFDLGCMNHGAWLRLERHRKFETNWPAQVPPHLHSNHPVVGVYGGHARIRSAKAGGRKTKDPWDRPGVDVMHDAMGVSRRYTVDELSQGIPPAYATFLGRQMLARYLERIAR